MDPADRKNRIPLSALNTRFLVIENSDTKETTRDGSLEESIKKIKAVSEKELLLIQARRIAQEKRTGRS